MYYSIDELKYLKKYRCWEGDIRAKCSKSLFGKDEISLFTYIKKNTDQLTEAEYNSIKYIKNNFHIIYENILKGLYEWQGTEHIQFEIFEEDTLTFTPVTFDSYKDIHQYIGTPSIEISHQCSKENYSYFAVNFNENCLLSIEHGFSMLFYKNDMIDIDAADMDTMIECLKYYEEDCTLWKKDFWLLKCNVDIEIYNDKDLMRKKWIE